MEHTCHADMCATVVRPRMFMCSKHWFMLPKTIRDLIWENYVPGQEIRKDPSKPYLDIAKVAIGYVADKEGP